MPQKLIDAPEPEHLSKHEVALYLHMSDGTLSRLVREGEFPPPFPLSPGVYVWHWREVAAYATLQAAFARQPPVEKRGGHREPGHRGDDEEHPNSRRAKRE